MRITREQVDEITAAFERLNLADIPSTLPLNIETLQKRFNARINSFLEPAELDEESRALMRKLLLIDEYKTFTDTGKDFFFNLFGDTIGLFAYGYSGDNFKIVRLCFTVPDNQRESQTLNLVFDAFTKSFLPESDGEEFISALKTKPEVVRDGVKFSLTQNDNLLTVTAVGE